MVEAGFSKCTPKPDPNEYSAKFSKEHLLEVFRVYYAERGVIFQEDADLSVSFNDDDQYNNPHVKLTLRQTDE